MADEETNRQSEANKDRPKREKQGQTVLKLQIATSCDIYCISLPIKMYIYLYIPLAHIYIYIYIYIHTYSTLKLVDKIFIEGAMPEKALKFAILQKN